MATLAAPTLHSELHDRRSRLQRAIEHRAPAPDLGRLLAAVDSALERTEGGGHALCVACEEPMTEELRRHPLGRYCLCDLSDVQRRALESDLDTAAQIQLGLLPPQDLICAGWSTHYRYLPAGPVSGDLVDVVAHADGSLWFLLGDVAGKGVSAALLMAHVGARYRSLIEAGRPLPEVVAALGDELYRRTASARYATLVAGRAAVDGSIEVANAGHVPALLLGARGVERLGATGLPAGLFAGVEYGVHRRSLASGDALVLYTDGLIESAAADGTEYGIDGLAGDLVVGSRADAGTLGARVLGASSAHRRGGPAHDDETLLVLHRD